MKWKNLLLAATLPVIIGCTSISGKIMAKYEHRVGYFQVPNGGKDISTSYHRPTFKEANLDCEVKGRLDVNFETKFGRLETYFEPSYLDSKATLKKDLLFNGVMFHKGDRLTFTYDNPEFGFNYFPLEFGDARLKFEPFISYFRQHKKTVLDEGSYHARRTRSRGILHGGIQATYQISKKDNLETYLKACTQRGYMTGHRSELGIFLETNHTIVGLSGFYFLDKDSQDEKSGDAANEELRKGIKIYLGYKF